MQLYQVLQYRYTAILLLSLLPLQPAYSKLRTSFKPSEVFFDESAKPLVSPGTVLLLTRIFTLILTPLFIISLLTVIFGYVFQGSIVTQDLPLPDIDRLVEKRKLLQQQLFEHQNIDAEIVKLRLKLAIAPLDKKIRLLRLKIKSYKPLDKELRTINEYNETLEDVKSLRQEDDLEKSKFLALLEDLIGLESFACKAEVVDLVHSLIISHEKVRRKELEMQCWEEEIEANDNLDKMVSESLLEYEKQNKELTSVCRDLESKIKILKTELESLLQKEEELRDELKMIMKKKTKFILP